MIDSKTQETLQRRGAELMGLVLIAFSVVIGLILFSYSPTDPGLASASDIPVQNWLGTFGANVASPLMLILGLGAWSFAIILFTWGIRFFLHKGSDRATTRLVFAPIAIALFSIYAASLVPAAAWTHNFGMGGLFGDTVVGSLLSFGAMVALGLFVLGFDKEELRTIARFLYIGVVMSYAALATAMGRGANKAIVVARDAHGKTAQRRDIKLSRDADVEDDFLEYDVAPKVEVNEPKSSFLSRMPL